jgi:hypothetical protein
MTEIDDLIIARDVKINYKEIITTENGLPQYNHTNKKITIGPLKLSNGNVELLTIISEEWSWFDWKSLFRIEFTDIGVRVHFQI